MTARRYKSYPTAAGADPGALARALLRPRKTTEKSRQSSPIGAHQETKKGVRHDAN